MGLQAHLDLQEREEPQEPVAFLEEMGHLVQRDKAVTADLRVDQDPRAGRVTLDDLVQRVYRAFEDRRDRQDLWVNKEDLETEVSQELMENQEIKECKASRDYQGRWDLLGRRDQWENLEKTALLDPSDLQDHVETLERMAALVSLEELDLQDLLEREDSLENQVPEDFRAFLELLEPLESQARTERSVCREWQVSQALLDQEDLVDFQAPEVPWDHQDSPAAEGNQAWRGRMDRRDLEEERVRRVTLDLLVWWDFLEREDCRDLLE